MSNPRMQRKIIKLDYPVQLPDRTLFEVNMRRMVVQDMLQCPISGPQDMEGEVALLARLCDLVPEELNFMDMADYGKLQDALVNFRRGKPSSPSGNDARLPAVGQTGGNDVEGSAESAAG